MGVHQVLLFEARDAAARGASLERVATELEVEARPLDGVLDTARRRLIPEVWRGDAASDAEQALEAKSAAVRTLGDELRALAAHLRREAAGQREDAAALRRQAENVLRQQQQQQQQPQQQKAVAP